MPTEKTSTSKLRSRGLTAALALAAALGLFAALYPTGGVADPDAASAQAAPDPQEAPAAEPLEEDEFLRIEAMREHLALTNRDLATYGFTGQNAQSLLTSLRQFSSDNAAELDRAEREIQQSSDRLTAVYRRIHMGDAKDAEIRSVDRLRVTHENAKQAQLAIIERFKPSVETAMPSNGRARWIAARSNGDMPGVRRYLAFSSDAERRAERKELSRGNSAIKARHQNTATQALLIRRQNIAAVSDADAQVLPRPASLGGYMDESQFVDLEEELEPQQSR